MKAQQEIVYGTPNTGCLVGTAYQKLYARLSEALETAGIPVTAAEYMILRVLYTKEGLQQCDIAQIVGKDQSAVCRTVSAMEKKKLVHTETVSHKCRRVFLAPTGTKLKPDIMEIARKRHDELSSILTPEELETFETILLKIIYTKGKLL